MFKYLFTLEVKFKCLFERTFSIALRLQIFCHFRPKSKKNIRELKDFKKIKEVKDFG
jgi:hypothetical protein